MARAAGDGRNYTVGIVDTKGKLVEELAGFPSVTTIIKATDASSAQGLMGWAYNTGLEGVIELDKQGKFDSSKSLATLKQRMKQAKLTPWSNRDKAAGRGSGIHDWAEKLLLGHANYDDVLEGTTRDDQGYARALISWHEQYQREPVALERVMVSLTRRYAGTVDLIDCDPAHPMLHDVSDFKTSKRIYDSQFVQGAAYAQAWEEMTADQGNPVAVQNVGVIRFDTSGKFEVVTKPYNGATVFNKMLGLYNELEKGR